MSGNNLVIQNTGLDHCYINGLPIVEAEIDIRKIFDRVSRISSLATHADPYFNNQSESQKAFNESHGEGDRITSDFLKEGAEELLPLFTPYQRWIPEGAYDTTPVVYEFKDQGSDFEWTNPDPNSIFVNSVEVVCVSGRGNVTLYAGIDELGTFDLPEGEIVSSYLATGLASFLGGSYIDSSYTNRQNVRNNNIPPNIDIALNSGDLVYDVKINAVKYDAIGWIKALTQSGDVKLPTRNDDIRICCLCKDFEWNNNANIKLNGVTIKHNRGSAKVSIGYNGIIEPGVDIDSNTIGKDFFGISEDISVISIKIIDPTEDFNYDLILNTDIPDIIPSPRFEYDSEWNKGKIIYRYQNMDDRPSDQKLNYSPETLMNVRVDPNIFDSVLKYLEDSLKNYVLKELYEATGYDKKAHEYRKKYMESRRQVQFWVGSRKGLQTGQSYAGV